MITLPALLPVPHRKVYFLWSTSWRRIAAKTNSPDWISNPAFPNLLHKSSSSSVPMTMVLSTAGSLGSTVEVDPPAASMISWKSAGWGWVLGLRKKRRPCRTLGMAGFEVRTRAFKIEYEKWALRLMDLGV